MAKSLFLQANVKWQKRILERVKAEVRLQLDNYNERPTERLRFISAQIAMLADSSDSHSQMLRYIFVISALVHHLRYGGLSSGQISRLAKLATAILQAQGVRPITSNLSYTFGELHMALSQIYRKMGDQWRAAWEQQLGLYLSRSDPPGGSGFLALTNANRALRLGHGSSALAEFELAEEHSQEDPMQWAKARLGRVIALRLADRLVEASQLIAAALNRRDLPDDICLELDWEDICLLAQQTGDLSKMMKAIRHGRPHHETGYLVEASIWAKIPASRQWLSEAPKVSYLASQKHYRPQRLGALYQFGRVLEESYDFQIPLPTRLRRIGDVLQHSPALVSSAAEVLTKAAITRWLWRSRAKGLGRLVYDRYSALCLSLSDGKCQDLMLDGVVDELEEVG